MKEHIFEMRLGLMIAGFCAAAASISALTVSLAAPSQGSNTPQGYVRMCTGYFNNPLGVRAAIDQENSIEEHFEIPRPPIVLASVRTALQHPPQGLPAISQVRNMSVAVIDLGNFSVAGAKPGVHNTDAVELDTNQGVVFASVTMNGDTIQQLQPLPAKDLERPYGFARGMAAYMLLNDVLAADATIPRQGCISAIKVQMSMILGVIPELTSAMLRVPGRDETAEKRALQAYRAFAASKQAQSNEYTPRTLARLGTSPTVSFIYRDSSSMPGAKNEIDVVRLSGNGVRTYMIAATDGAGNMTMSAEALCVVGDSRCAGYYEWP